MDFLVDDFYMIKHSLFGVTVPVGALLYFNRTLSNLTQATTDQVNGANTTATIRSGELSVDQTAGGSINYPANTAAFDVGVGMVVPAGTVATDSGFLEAGLLVDTSTTCVLSNYWTGSNYKSGVNYPTGLITFREGGDQSATGTKYNDLCALAMINGYCRRASDGLVLATITGTSSNHSLTVDWHADEVTVRAAMDAGTPFIFDLTPSDYFTIATALSTMISDVRALRVDAGDDGAELDALGTPALWSTNNLRAGMGEDGKTIVLDALTNGAVFFENGDLSLSVAGANIQAKIGATVATIAAAGVTDAEQVYVVYDDNGDGKLYAEANGVRGIGVVSAAPALSNTFTQGCDAAGTNHFAGVPTFPTMLVQDITP